MNLLASSPVGRWPLYQLETGEPFDMSSWYNWVGGVGALCWLIAYVITIVTCQREKTYGVPLLAICLNFTWELMDSFFLPDPIWLWKVIDRSWLLVDIAILSQLLRFGRQFQGALLVRRYFLPLVLTTLLLAFVGQYSWVTTLHDTLGIILAFVINLIMSGLFLSFYFERRETGAGLSLPVAWLKMLGTLLSSVQCTFLLPIIHPTTASTTAFPTYAFFYFLFAACFILDCAYIALLYSRPSAVSPGSSATGFAVR